MESVLHPRYRYSGPKSFIRMEPESILARDSFLALTSDRDLEIQDCFICSSFDFNLINEVDRYGFFYPTGMCRTCGNVQQTAYYSDQDLLHFYSKFYRTIYGNMSPADLFDHQRSTSGPQIWQFVNPILNPKSVLEVGCGAGGNLSIFRENGCEVLGLDFDEQYLSAARQNGLSVREGSINVLDKSEKFDLIILNHVLEHLVSPARFLRDLSSHCSDNGFIYIEVPSLDRVSRGGYESDLLLYWQNAHTIHFTTETLSLLGLKAGLKKIMATSDIRSLWKPTSPHKKLADSDLSASLEHSKKLLYLIERKRESSLFQIALFARKLALKFLRKAGLYIVVKKLFSKLRLLGGGPDKASRLGASGGCRG